jgi:outer membrane immunogenic protein
MGGVKNMYRLVKFCVVAAALVAAPVVAEAADQGRPVYRAAPPVPYYDWSGFYVGVHAGFGSNDGESGVLGGGQVGFNYQVGQWVFGVEGEFSGTSLGGESASIIAPGFGAVTAEVNHSWLSTVAFRAGWAFDRWLVYGKFGAAWANVSADVIATGMGGQTVAVSIDDTVSGWVFGVGTEYAFLNNWSAKFEYNMLDLGNDFGIDGTAHVFKAGLNYRFSIGPGGPGFRGGY